MPNQTIDLGSSPDDPEEVSEGDTKGPSKTYYPSLYVSDVDSLDEIPDTGTEFEFTAKGTVVSKTISERDGEKCCSFEIEVQQITPTGSKVSAKQEDASDGLDKAMDDVVEKKSKKS